MHLGLRDLSAFLDANRSTPHLVLATVVATEGSTYRKPGAMMLVNPDGEFAGMISGGCLEGDLVGHAEQVFADGSPRRVTYDLAADSDEAWALGLGCGGQVHLLLQRLQAADGFGLLGRMFAALEKRETCYLALCIRDDPACALGSHAITTRKAGASGHPALISLLGEHCAEWASPGRWRHLNDPGWDGDGEVLLVRIDPPPRVLVCGAGPDAPPLVRQVTALGWECWVMDHRAGYADPGRFDAAARVVCARPETLSGQVPLDTVAAAVVMTHNLEHDATYLRQLTAAQLPYLGLLGPAERRRQLQDELGVRDAAIHGPAGLDIGAELPEAIALSIMAEIYQVLNVVQSASAGRV